MVAIELGGVEVRYGGGGPALDEVDVAVGSGELLAVIGPSGSGKTTLLHLIAGLLAPSRGDVLFDGRTVVGVPPRDRDVALVQQGGVVFPFLDVAANIGFGLRVRGAARDEIDRRVATAAGELEIGPLLSRPATSLSGGERRRVALARAFVRRPRVLLLDEPFAELDPRRRRALTDRLRRLRDADRPTTVLVTHDPTDAFALADRIAVLIDGRVRQVGLPGDVLARPASLGVARLVHAGPLAELRGVVRPGHDGTPVFESGPIRFEANGDGECVAALRPRDVVLADSGDRDAAAGVVISADDGGESRLLRVEIDDGSELFVRCERSSPATVGDAVRVRVVAERASVFPAGQAS